MDGTNPGTWLLANLPVLGKPGPSIFLAKQPKRTPMLPVLGAGADAIPLVHALQRHTVEAVGACDLRSTPGLGVDRLRAICWVPCAQVPCRLDGLTLSEFLVWRRKYKLPPFQRGKPTKVAFWNNRWPW